VDETLAELRRLADLGIDTAHGRVANVSGIDALELMGREIIPAAEKF
jgi:hypothetical protein